MPTRRTVLKHMVTGCTMTGLLPWISGCSSNPPERLIFSTARDRQGQFSARIASPDQVWQHIVPLPARGHGIAIHPTQPVIICCDRRPGQNLHLIDGRNGALLKRIGSQPNRHFYGHATFSADGKKLFAAENALNDGRGMIGVYETSHYNKVAEFSAHAIGPHEIHLHPDNRTLVVANGGIMTHPATGRQKLNLATMQPRLSYIDSHTGELLEEHSFQHHQLSIRHLDIAPDGTVVFGMQYQGDSADIRPLVALHRRGESIRPMQADDADWLQLNQYIASVCVLPEADTIVTTAPRGNTVTFWRLSDQQLMNTVSVNDAAGVTAISQHTAVVSNGIGELIHYSCRAGNGQETQRLLYPNCQWDNHLTS
ncbi:DUF1513 domain-containing protein [Kistimonas scapharcae]|uniref:DUF1513 domain-containing protein n=1 Tax=Kistimonas scapharcae TaxID=1036133 RepID=A0ABP8V8B1_9GAMM